jgi:hypothetical protein
MLIGYFTDFALLGNIDRRLGHPWQRDELFSSLLHLLRALDDAGELGEEGLSRWWPMLPHSSSNYNTGIDATDSRQPILEWWPPSAELEVHMVDDPARGI